MVGHHRSVVEGTNGRGLGDLAKEASVGRSRADEGVKVHVGQCCESERVGGAEGGTQGRRGGANVVDNRAHEASLFCSVRRCEGACRTSPSLDFAGGPGAVYYIRVPARVPVGPIAQ